MRPTLCILLLGMGLGVCGCDSFHGPPLAISTAADDTGSKQTSSTSTKTPGPPRPPTNRPLIVYNGHTVEQWAQLLQSADRQQVFEACQALTVLGYEGRYLLFQGLESPHAETRLLCLEHLAVSDFKKQGETGRRLLVKLAADPDDIRIRDRATSYLGQWNRAVPAP